MPVPGIREPSLVWGAGKFERWARHVPVLWSASGTGRGSVALIHGRVGIGRYPAVEALVSGLETAGYRVHTVCAAREPRNTDIDEALERLRPCGVDRVLAVGGGSVIDTGKVLAAMLTVDGRVGEYLEGVGHRAHPGTRTAFIAVPTTGGTGSEATSNGVIGGELPDGTPYKRSLRHPNFVPDLAVLDPSLMTGVPAAVTAASGMDALCQLLESHFSVRATAETRRWTAAGLELASYGLEKAAADGSLAGPRLAMALAAYASGLGLSNAGLGLVHGIAGTLGSHTPTPHGVACARLAGPCFSRVFRTMERTGHPDLDEVCRIARLFVGPGSDPVGRWCRFLSGLAERLGIPRLSTFGFGADLIPLLADKADNRNSTMPLGRADIESALRELD